MENGQKNIIGRVAWVDICKCICMLCVITVHLESCTTWLSKAFGVWFLTAFFFVSGYCHKSSVSFKELIIKKVKGLLLPWFIFSNLNIFLSAVLSFKGDRNIGEELFWNFLQIRGIMDGLWFINCLFVAYIPLYFFAKIRNKTTALCLSFLLSILSTCYSFYMDPNQFPWGNSNLPWHLESAFTASFWMLLGFYFKQKYEAIYDKLVTKKMVPFVVGSYVLSVLFLLNLDKTIFRELYRYVPSLFGVFFIVMISKKIQMNKYVGFVGANTLLYFAFHGKVLALIENIMHTKLSAFYETCLNNELYSSCLAIITTIVISLVLIIPVKFVNRYLPQTLGRW